MKSNGTIYWYGANSASLEESDLSGNLQRWYYFFDGQRVGRSLTTNEVGFYMTDALGSVRYLGGSATGYSFDYFPFGAPILDSDTGDDRYQFTGKERDSESGLDNFGARYMSSQYGRFMQPDPLLNSGQPWNPQSWNRYAYTENNPLRYTDPTGLYKFGNCSGTDDQCQADRQRYRDSIAKANEALKGLDPNSKEAKALQKTLNKLGAEGTGNIKINFGDAGKTDGLSNLGRTVGNDITINYDAVDSTVKAANLNASEAAALDAGVTTHEGTHAFGSGLFGFMQGRFEHPAYYTESVTYQGLHNTDKAFSLWNESWLTVDQDKLSIETHRENAIQNAIHPPKQQQKQENPQ